MKKAAVLIMSIFMASASVLGMSACEDGKKAEVQPVQDYTSYTLEGYTAPIWKQSVIGNETVMFVGKDDVTPLLFTPDEIISVRSADLKTTYEEGVDYVLQDGKIGLTENTSIPYWEEAEYYPEQEIPGRSYEKKGGGYLLYGEGTTFTYKQIAITYRHSGSWSGYTPEDQSSEMSRILDKLKKKEPVTIVFYGDSIMAGNYSVSGGPQWCQMIVDYLAARFEYEYPEDIQVYNSSEGGQNSSWAIENIGTKVAGYDPDLLVYAFGMNDYGSTPLQYSMQLVEAVDAVQDFCPDCDIMLVSPFRPNPEADYFDKQQKDFEPELVNIANEYEHVGYARVTSMHNELLKVKRYYDMTFNNINHPNEFMCRVYATTILSAMLGNDYVTLDPNAEDPGNTEEVSAE